MWVGGWVDFGKVCTGSVLSEFSAYGRASKGGCDFFFYFSALVRSWVGCCPTAVHATTLQYCEILM